jgi:hypothetical protein
LDQAVGIPIAALLVVAVLTVMILAVVLVPNDLMVVEGDEGEALLQLKR